MPASWHAQRAGSQRKMDDLLSILKRQNIKINGGPDVYSGRRKVLFIRDPDGNVLEFDEWLGSGPILSDRK